MADFFQYFQYYVEFTINDILGVSILDNPLEVFGLIILLAVLVFVTILSRKLLKISICTLSAKLAAFIMPI